MIDLLTKLTEQTLLHYKANDFLPKFPCLGKYFPIRVMLISRKSRTKLKCLGAELKERIIIFFWENTCKNGRFCADTDIAYVLRYFQLLKGNFLIISINLVLDLVINVYLCIRNRSYYFIFLRKSYQFFVYNFQDTFLSKYFLALSPK